MSTQALVLNHNSLIPLTGSLEGYLHWINRIPILTYEEELDLTKTLVKCGDKEVARRLVVSHLRFVVKIARGYLGYGLSLADLIQEGTLGLIKAVKRFDPEKKVRLVTFAVHWIKAEIHEFILRNWRIVKIVTTKAQRKLFFNLRKKTKARNWFTNQEVAMIAEDLQVPEKEVRTMEARMYGSDLSLDSTSNQEDEVSPVEYLVKSEEIEEEDDAEKQSERIGNLKASLQVLDQRSRDIVEQRWLSENKTTLQSLARKYHVSYERIRQIEEKAMGMLRRTMS